MIKETDGSFQDKNSELLHDIYIPAINKSRIENSTPFKILKENKQDVTELFTGQKNEMYQPIEIKKFEEKDKESAAEFHLNTIKEIGNNLFDFVDQSVVGDTVDYAASGFDKEKIPPTFGILANNIGEFGVNMLPVMDKLIDFMGKPPGPDGKIPDMLNNDEKLMEWSGEKVKYFKENRAKFKAIQEDANMASQFANLVVQDSLVSLPLYEGLTKAGVPKVWATVLGFGMGSAIALEEKLFGMESTFIQEYGKEEVNALKKILSIIPNTPVDALADEVIQTLEYTAFAFAIPPIIQAAKFMKTNLPSFAVGGAVAGALEGNDDPNEVPMQEFNLGIDQGKKKSEINLDDQSAVPGTVNEYGFEKTSNLLKAGFNAITKSSTKPTPVFNSAVKKAVENIAEKGSGEQILGSIKNVPGVKANEIKWIGLDTFLEGKKSVTKKEVVDFVNQNNIDVTEVKQGGDIQTVKLSEDVEFKKNEFERKILADIYKKDPEMRGEVPEELLEDINYDNFTPIAMTDIGIKDKVMLMDFNTMRTILGENPNIADYKVLPNGNLRNLNGAEDDFVNKGYFEITPFDFEKYQVEEAVRKFRQADIKAPKFESQTEPGGEEYTELVFKIKKGGMDVGIPTEVKGLDNAGPFGSDDAGEFVTKIKNTPYKNSSHMNIKSEIAHVRFKTRMNGNMKILTVEEMQSDFAIAALKSNKRSSADNPKITDFPFKNNWYEMVSKRLIRHAADNDFDAVAIPKGIVSAKRYRQNIDPADQLVFRDIIRNDARLIEVKFKDTEKVRVMEQYYPIGANGEFRTVEIRKNFIRDVGKENAENYLKKYMNNYDNDGIRKTNFIDDEVVDLKNKIIVGDGKGKYELYDKAIPSFMKKYGKKWNAKVYDDTIDDEAMMGASRTKFEIPVTILEITPSMKKSVQEEGQSLFEILGIGTGAAIAAESISDSKGNNTISNLTQ